MGTLTTIGACARCTAPRGHLADEPSRAEVAFLEGVLRHGELPLVWLRASSASLPAGRPTPSRRARWRLLVSDQRAALIAVASRRVEALAWLSRQEADCGSRLGRWYLEIGGVRLAAKLNDGGRLAAAASLLPLEPPHRLREAARLSWCAGQRRDHRSVVVELLGCAVERYADPLDQLTLSCVAGELDPAAVDPERRAAGEDRLGPPLQRLVDGPRPPEEIARWAERWQISLADRRIVADRLLRCEPPARAASLSVALERPLRRARGGRGDSAEAAAADAGFARRLLRAGQRREARRIVTGRLAALGPAAAAEPAVQPTADGVLPGGPVAAARRDLLLVLDELAAEPTERLDWQRQLAELEPLTAARVAALREASDGARTRRAAEVLGLLEPGALAAPAEPVAARPVAPIDPDLLETRLPHPAAREPGRLVPIQQWLGKAQQPDYGTIKSYSERASAGDHPALLDALADATLMLGLDGVEGFVSRGERRLGIRAYDGTPPFLVVGGEHLDPDAEGFLTEGELRFAVAAEVAHLRFGYTRLTSSELWDGVLHRGKQLLDLAATLAGPLGALGNVLRGARQVSMVERGLRQVGVASRKAAGVLGVAKELQQLWSRGSSPAPPDDPEDLDPTGEQLLAACLAMQLGADRAGLVLAGDLRSAMRAVFLSSPVYAAELNLAVRHGLAKSLARRDADGELPQRSLTLRLASLAAFYLGEDYSALIEALG